MRIGLISDTHDNLPLVHSAARFFRETRPERVFHLGDVMSPEVLDALEGLPLTVLLGNNDDPRELEGATLDWDGLIDGVHVHAHHGHLKPKLNREPDLLVHGHTHRRRVERVGRTLVVNPGALYRAPTRTIAIIELPKLLVTYYEVLEDSVVPFQRRS